MYRATLQLDVTYPEPFSYLSGVRELSDGTIFAADPLGQVLLRIDLDAGTADTIGRQGAGPQEYEGPDQVFPLPGDSTLLVDLGNGLLTVIDPEGSFVDWTPMTTSTESAPLGARTIRPQFVDSAGNIYATGPYDPEGPPDSSAIHRIDRASGEERPVADTWHTEYVSQPRGARRPIMAPYDAWAVGADGRVAVVRANGYSVEWYSPDGSVVHGPRNAVETFPVGPAEMDAEIESFASNAIYSVAMVGEGGVESRQMHRGLPPGMSQEVDDFAWPDVLPVFRSDRVLVSPRSEAWVERYMPAGGPGRVEIFDEHGVRTGSIELPTQARVIGFAAQGEPGSRVYVARTDDVGLVWLERYRVSMAGG